MVTYSSICSLRDCSIIACIHNLRKQKGYYIELITQKPKFTNENTKSAPRIQNRQPNMSVPTTTPTQTTAAPANSNSQEKLNQPTNQKVTFKSTVQVKVIPQCHQYSREQVASLWYSQVEMELMKEQYYLEQERRVQNAKKNRSNGGGSNYGSNKKVTGSDKQKSRKTSPTLQLRKTLFKLFPRQ